MQFDLEKAVAGWKKGLRGNRAFDEEDLEELEAHLRDHVETLRATGLADREAYQEAVRRLGPRADVEAEFGKVRYGRRKRQQAFRTDLTAGFQLFRSYLTVARRSLARQKGYTAINVVGLGLGIACCAVIALYVWGELAYDRFHEGADRIYRIESDWRPNGGNISLASVNYPFVEVVRTQHPELTVATLWRVSGSGAVARDDRAFHESGLLYANQALFDVFSFGLERGDERTALARPYTVVLSRELARKYFGDEDPVGKTLRFFGEFDVTVTGVLAPPSGPTHIPFTAVLSWPTLAATGWDQDVRWGANNSYAYLRFPPGADPAALEASFPALIERYAGDEWPGSTLALRALTDVHLHSEHSNELAPGGNPAYVRLFTVVALFILLLAVVNFVNLSTARSLERAKEVGVRKSVGARRGQLARQFLAEAVLMAVLGLGVAAVLVAVAVPPLTALVGRPLLPDARTLGVAAAVAAVGTLLVGVIGGLYPAFALTRFRPAEVLRGRFATGRGGVRLRQGLVVFQFAVAVVLLVGTFVVYGQLQHLRTADLGFDEAQVLALRGSGAELDQRLAFADALRAEAAIEGVASTWEEQMPAELLNGGSVILPGAEAEGDEGDDGAADGVAVRLVVVSAGFFETMGVPLVAGRDFEPGATVDTMAIILNEAAARAVAGLSGGRYAAPRDLIGETVESFGERPVLAIVPDFHMASLHEEVMPTAFFLGDSDATFVVRVAPGAVEPALAAVRRTWAEFFPEAPLDYNFLDEAFGAAYRAEEQLGALALLFAALAIGVACLGLFGLAAYAAEQRRKEIGVRKVLGASARSVVALLSRDFVGLVLIAVVVAAPFAYVALDTWLEGFPSRIALGPAPFLEAGVLAILLALVTVSGQALRAALTDPVKALRTE